MKTTLIKQLEHDFRIFERNDNVPAESRIFLNIGKLRSLAPDIAATYQERYCSIVKRRDFDKYGS